MSDEADGGVARTVAALGLRVFERGWLSSNGVLCNVPDAPTAIVDTGYAKHAELTVALVRHALGARALDVIVNTHLHSDHCGGNAALQRAWPGARTLVPQTSLVAVQRWDEDALTFRLTDQRCERFRADAGLRPGDTLPLGSHAWQVHAAPGHDPDAVMLFEPTHRVLISGDALWEKRLAIVFPALADEGHGFDANRTALDVIESLAPALVIPGHGRPFTDVASALAASRKRLDHYERQPRDHTLHAHRALLMFHMLEHEARDERDVLAWLQRVAVLDVPGHALDEGTARTCIESLITPGVLQRTGKRLTLAAANR